MSLRIPTLTSTNFTGLVNERFWNNFWPIPATNSFLLGAAVPDFELPDVTSNQTVRASRLWYEQPLIVAFTRIFTENQYCPLCLPHIHALNAAVEQFQQQGARVLMITSTDAAQSQKVVTDLGLKLSLLSNPSCSVFRSYGTGQALGAPLPAQFIIDTQGRLRYKHLFSFFEPNASIDSLLATLSRIKST